MVYKTLVNTFVLEWFYSYTSALAIKSEASFVTASMILLFWQMFHILNRRSGFLSLRGKKSNLMVAGKSNIKSSSGAAMSSWGSEEQLEPQRKANLHSSRTSVRNWREVDWDFYSLFLYHCEHSWGLYHSASSSAGDRSQDDLYQLEGFLFCLGRSQDSIKSRSKIVFLGFVLVTVYLGKGTIGRKAPFHSVAFTLKLFGAKLGNLFDRIKKYLQWAYRNSL